jgi:hypothetical protein
MTTVLRLGIVWSKNASLEVFIGLNLSPWAIRVLFGYSNESAPKSTGVRGVMNKLIQISCLLASAVLCGNVMADDICRAGQDKTAATLAAADNLASADKATKCKAYMRAWLVATDSLTACKNTVKSDADAKALMAKFKPLMEQLAHGEQTYCGQ